MAESSQTLAPDSVLKIVCLSLTPCLPSTNGSDKAVPVSLRLPQAEA